MARRNKNALTARNRALFEVIDMRSLREDLLFIQINVN
jgi:hypothetical protein